MNEDVVVTFKAMNPREELVFFAHEWCKYLMGRSANSGCWKVVFDQSTVRHATRVRVSFHDPPRSFSSEATSIDPTLALMEIVRELHGRFGGSRSLL